MEKKKKLYSCSVESCDKAYSRPCLVEQHRRSHFDERPFTCSLCKKGFMRSAHLKTHMLSHSAVKPFNCEFCSKGFVTNQQLSRHLRTHKDADAKSVLPLLANDDKLSIGDYEHSASLFSEFNAIMSLPDHPLYDDASSAFTRFGSTSDSSSEAQSYGVVIDESTYNYIETDVDPQQDIVPREWACHADGCDGLLLFDSLGDLVLHCDQSHHEVPVALHSLYDDISFPPLFMPPPLGIEDIESFYDPDVGCPVQHLLAKHELCD